MMCKSIVGWFSLVMIWWNQKSINQLYAKAWLALTGLLIIQPPSMSNRDSCLPPWWHHRILAPLSSHPLSSCVGVLDSIAVSLFVDWLSLSNPNNNLVMRRSGLSKGCSSTIVVAKCLSDGKTLKSAFTHKSADEKENLKSDVMSISF